MDGHVRVAALAAGLGASGGNHAAVREESHLEDMRSAIRGDFARLAERRGDQELLSVRAEPEELGSDHDHGHDHEPDQRRRSWFARFVSP